jgi:hypothetical protein
VELLVMTAAKPAHLPGLLVVVVVSIGLFGAAHLARAALEQATLQG